MQRIKFIFYLIFLFPQWVFASCTITTPSFNFGDYDPQDATPTTGTGTLTTSCTNDGIMDYMISSSAGNSGAYLNRYVAHGANHLSYNLYVNPSYSSIWGNGSPGTSIITRTRQQCGKVPCTELIYGRIPALQSAPPGQYTDMIAIILQY